MMFSQTQRPGPLTLLSAIAFALLSAWGPVASAQEAAPAPAPVPTPAEREAAGERALERVEGLEGAGLRLDGGVAEITGIADDPAVLERASVAVKAATGATEVDNRIRLSAAFEDRVRGAATRVGGRWQRVASYLPLVPLALGVLVIGILLAWALGRWRWAFERVSTNPFLRDIVRRVVQVAVLLAGVLLALDIVDAMALVGGVLGAAGVAGIAIGFAFRDLIENYIASVLLSLRQPFRPQDHVVIEGHEGLVTSMNARTTVLTTFDGNIVRLPNALVFKSPLINYSTDPRRRFTFDVGVGYDVDLAQAVEVGTRVMASGEGVMADPGPFALVTRLGDSSITLTLFGWVDQSSHDFARVRSASMQRVKAEYDRLDIDMPEPAYKVSLSGGVGPTPGAPAAPAPPAREEEEPASPTPVVHDVSRDTTAEEISEASTVACDSENLLRESGAME